MRIATYNVDGVNERLANLLEWLEEPGRRSSVCRSSRRRMKNFQRPRFRAAGYGAVWHGQKSWNGVAILARGAEPEETLRGRAIPTTRIAVTSKRRSGVLWSAAFICRTATPRRARNSLVRPPGDYAKELLASGAPVVLAGDYNVMPTERDVYAPERWVDDALFRPEMREARVILMLATEGHFTPEIEKTPAGEPGFSRERSMWGASTDRGLVHQNSVVMLERGECPQEIPAAQSTCASGRIDPPP